jgi:Carbohydrate-selective porin, OprB family
LIYGMANQAVHRSDAGSDRGLDITVGFDWSRNDVNRENSETIAGFRYNGPFSSRPQDGVAFAFVYTKIGDAFQSVGIPLGAPLLGAEKAIEANYAPPDQAVLALSTGFSVLRGRRRELSYPPAAVFGFRTKVNF